MEPSLKRAAHIFVSVPLSKEDRPPELAEPAVEEIVRCDRRRKQAMSKFGFANLGRGKSECRMQDAGASSGEGDCGMITCQSLDLG
jgi:hypothetical protein